MQNFQLQIIADPASVIFQFFSVNKTLLLLLGEKKTGTIVLREKTRNSDPGD